MKPCKHLDYNTDNYPTCILRFVPGMPGVAYWERTVVPYPEAPRKVQFCGLGRGRINAVFDCYDGTMSCYEPEAASASSSGGESTKEHREEGT